MNPNHFHPMSFLVLPILLALLAGCTSRKPESSNLLNPDVGKGVRLDDNQAPHLLADRELRSNDQKQVANRATLHVQTGRYSVLAATPSHPQGKPLDVIIDVSIPEACISIEQAMQFLLRRSGYALATNLSADIIELLAKPLPAVHRTLGPMPLKDALTLLVTPGFVLQDEPIKRLIRFIPLGENRGGS